MEIILIAKFHETITGLLDLRTGGTVGIRSVSKSGGLTIDVNIFGIPINKIHLP